MEPRSIYLPPSVLGASTYLVKGTTTGKRIKDRLSQVLQEASGLQEISSSAIQDLEKTLEDVKQDLDVKGEALNVLKQRIDGEVSEFKRELGEQLKALKADFGQKFMELQRDIEEKEHQWENWKIDAERNKEGFCKDVGAYQGKVEEYKTLVGQLRNNRVDLETLLKSRLRRINITLDEESAKELRLHDTLEQSLLQKVKQIKEVSDGELADARTKWKQESDEIDEIVVGLSMAKLIRDEQA